MPFYNGVVNSEKLLLIEFLLEHFSEKNVTDNMSSALGNRLGSRLGWENVISGSSRNRLKKIKETTWKSVKCT